MVRLLVVVTIFTINYAIASVEKKEFAAKDIENLVLKNLTGDVKVTVSNDEYARVAAHKVDFDDKCSLKIEAKERKLVVEVEENGWLLKSDCKVNFDIQLPKEVAMDLKLGSGDLDVRGTKGKMEFTLGSGDASVDAEIEKINAMSGSGSIKISGTVGDSEIKTGSGSIEVDGLTSSAKLKSGSGDFRLSYKSSPQKGELDIKTGSGDAVVSFPSSTKLSTSFMAGSGSIVNELGDTPKSNFKVSMKTGSGDLKIVVK